MDVASWFSNGTVSARFHTLINPLPTTNYLETHVERCLALPDLKPSNGRKSDIRHRGGFKISGDPLWMVSNTSRCTAAIKLNLGPQYVPKHSQ